MAFDPARASFVQQEYRFEEAEDLNVRAVYQTARQYQMNTNLTSLAVANALADAIFAESRKSAQSFSVEIEGIVTLDMFEGGPPRYEVRSTKYGLNSGKVFKAAEFECDPFNKRTKFSVRG